MVINDEPEEGVLEGDGEGWEGTWDEEYGGQRLMMKILAQTSAAVTHLAKRGSQDLLGGSLDSSSSSSGARGAAAMELQRQEMETNASSVALAIRTNLARANGSSPSLPQDAWAYFTKYGSCSNHQRDIAMVTAIFSTLWNFMEQKQTEEAHALIGASLAVMDQWAMKGDLEVPFLWTHVPEPTFGAQSSAPTRRLQPFTRLCPPKWAVASAAYLKDMEILTGKLSKTKRESEDGLPKKPWRPRGGNGRGGKAGKDGKGEKKED